MAFWDAIWTGIVYFFSLFWTWLSIFAAPFIHLEMLWIIIPIYLSWIFTEVFQERRGTSLGNAITNGVVTFWVSVDWTKTLVNTAEWFSWGLVLKFLFVLLVFGYGLVIAIEGMRGRDFVTRFGRVRETSYVMLMFTPIIYGVLEVTLKNLLAMILFFPLFYFLFELVNRKLLPKLGVTKVEEEEEKIEKERKMRG